MPQKNGAEQSDASGSIPKLQRPKIIKSSDDSEKKVIVIIVIIPFDLYLKSVLVMKLKVDWKFLIPHVLANFCFQQFLIFNYYFFLAV